MDQENERLAAIARSHATIADKIRALAAEGVPRAGIARFLGKRYQHVRNVLEGDAQSGGGYVLGKADLSGVRENPAPYRAERDDRTLIEQRGPGVYWLRLRSDGSLPLPQEFVDALAATPGARVFAKLEDGELKIISGEEAMRRARAIVRTYIPPGSNLVDEFLAERRAMWGEEDD